MDPSHLVAETGVDLSMAIRKLKTRGFGSGSPASALVLSLMTHHVPVLWCHRYSWVIDRVILIFFGVKQCFLYLYFR